MFNVMYYENGNGIMTIHYTYNIYIVIYKFKILI